MRDRVSWKILVLAIGMLTAVGLAPWSAASAYTLKTLYSFCPVSGCSDGNDPQTGLLMDSSGNLYGTTSTGGAHKHGGTIFELVHSKHGNLSYVVLYSFCALKKCADGSSPSSSLVMDTAGNLYGTTENGGKRGVGVAFELMPNAERTVWTLKVLHTFCSTGGDACTDGQFPYPGADLTYAGAATGALYDGVSPLYGTAENDGSDRNGGVAFELIPGTKNWTEKVLHTFCTSANCADGKTPQSGMIMDDSGNLFGMTFRGKDNQNGVVFELSPNAHKTQWTETVLYPFCSLANCADGVNPRGELLRDASGNLFGTAENAGNGASCPTGEFEEGCGVVFKLVPNGAASQETVLYNFCSQPNCTDGDNPPAGLVMDPTGNLLGTTTGGGHVSKSAQNGGGTVFTLNGTEQVLYGFCAQTKCSDGLEPSAQLIMDKSGNIFGTTEAGGAHGKGTVFELTP